MGQEVASAVLLFMLKLDAAIERGNAIVRLTCGG